LTTRIYLLAILTIVTAAVTVAGILTLFDRPVVLPPFGRFLVAEVVAHRDDPEAMQRIQALLQAHTDADFTVHDGQDRLLVSSADSPHAPVPASERARMLEEVEFVRGRPARAVVSVVEDGAIVGYGQFSLSTLLPYAGHVALPLGLFLAFLAITSALLARSLARPITHLTRTARAFGSGDHEVRARLDRGDEIGQLAATFDEMADRITALMRAQQELLANVSHELRTPIARIRVALDIAALGDAEQARAQLPEIEQDLAELERLVGDVLVTARLSLDGGAMQPAELPMRPESVPADQIVAAAVERFGTRHSADRLVVDATPPLPTVEADPMLLRRVIDNLLDNAVRASDESEPVTLRAACRGDLLTIEVQDTGIGIREEDLARVFRPFFRADQSRTRDTGGIGLGLALSRRIVEAHGGSISLQSEPGQGTTARFTIPAEGEAPKTRDRE